MQRECLLQLAVIRGINLPSVDLLSKIDAYVKVKVNGGLVGQTRAVDDKSDPVWDKDMFASLPLSNNRTPAGTITFELWDENTLKDTLIATAVLDLGRVDPAALHYLELPLNFEKSKHAVAGALSRLVVSVRGWVNSFGTLVADTQHVPGAMFNTVDRRAYLPVACPGLPVCSIYMAVEYEEDAVDLKLLVCSPHVPLHVDMFLLGRQVSKVRRRTFCDGHQVLPGLVAYEEVKMDDIPLCTDWRQLCAVVFDKALLWSGNSDAVVSAHGWRGAMNFEGACRALHGLDVDHSTREIYMPLTAADSLQAPSQAFCMPPEALLLVDYDNSNVGLLLSCMPDIKLAVLDSPNGLDKAWDLTLLSGQQVKKTSQVFVPSQARAGGKWRVCRVCELDDVAYGTAFSSILLHKYQLSNQRQWDVLSLVPLR